MHFSIIFGAVAVFVVFDVLIVFFVIKHLKKKMGDGPREHWQWLADRHQLELSGGDPYLPQIAFLSFLKKPYSLSGPLRENTLNIYQYAVGSGKNSTTYITTRVVGPNAKKLTFRFSKEGFFSKIGKLVGMQDVQTGDRRFDGMFIIKSSDPKFTSSAMLDEIKQKFYELWETHGAKGVVELSDDELYYQEVGTIHDLVMRERIGAATDLVCELRGVVEYYNQ